MANKNISDSEQELLDTFLNKLNKLMYEKKIERDSQLLNNINISQSRFSLIRNKKAVPKIIEIKEIADFFKVPTDYFLYADNNETNTHITWKDWTNKDVIEMLIDMFTEKTISFKTTCKYIDYELVEIDKYGVFISDSYIEEKIKEWLRISEPFTKEFHSYNWEILEVLKKGFLKDIDEKPFYLPFPEELPFDIPTDIDEDLPFE